MKPIPLVLTCILATTLANCAVTTAGIKKGDERNLSRSFNDVSARRVIVARLSRVETYNLDAVNVDVAEGIGVLTGTVSSQEARVEAERVAWSAPNITQIGNEIQVEGQQGFFRNSRDGVLEQSIRARLTADNAVKGRNFNLEVHNGVVYLLGVARTPDELTRAAEIASTTRGTREVVSYVKIHGDDVNPVAQAAQVPYGTSSYDNFYTAPQPQIEPYYVNPQTGAQFGAPSIAAPTPYSNSYTQPPTAPQRLTDLGPRTGKAFPTDKELGQYRSGSSGEAVSVIESAPYYIDPDTGQEIPVSYIQGTGTAAPPF